jgi:selenocysteine-specific elongation factor
MARVSLLDRDRLEPGEAAPARLTLQEPIGALARDRLVLRDTGATATIGGGVVLDPFPPRRGRRTPIRLAQLAALDAPAPLEALRGILAAGPGWVEQPAFVRAWNVTEPASLIAAAPAREAGDLILAPAAFERIARVATDALAAHHKSAPELPGLQIERLRQAVPDRPPPTGFAGIVTTLVREGVLAQDGPWLRLPGHRISLSPMDEKIWARTAPLLAEDRFRPPRVRDMAGLIQVPEPVVRATMKRLARMGQVIEIAQDHFFLRATVAEMATIAAASVDADGLLTAAAFRDRLDNGRKVAIQILEFFDKAGVTVRSGDVRRVRNDRLGVFGSAVG